MPASLLASVTDKELAKLRAKTRASSKAPSSGGRRPATVKAAPIQPTFPEFQASWFKAAYPYPKGTYPEYLCFWALNTLGLKCRTDPRPKMQGPDFDYQVIADGGRSEIGGFIPDFVVYHIGPTLALYPTNEHWHPVTGKSAVADKRRYAALRAKGIDVVLIEDVHLLQNARFYVQAAVYKRQTFATAYRGF